MPPKRKRGETTKSKAAVAASGENDDEDMSESLKSSMTVLLENLKLLSMDKSRCSETLSALTEGRCLGEASKKDEHPDCYWVLLSTHVINRMIQVLERESTDESESVAVVLAALCYALTNVFLSDKVKLERSANAATASHNAAKFVRSVLGRAIVTITIGSTLALEHLVGTVQYKADPFLIRKALWSALFSLDMVVHFNIVKPAVSVDGWHFALNSLLEDAATLNVDIMETTIQSVENVMKLTMEEESLIQSLVEINGPPMAEKAKRGGRRSSTKKSSVLADTFGLIAEIAPANTISLDGRISVRRWASMAFVWLCQGETRGMDIVLSLLENEEMWGAILNCPARSIEMEAHTKKKGGKGKKTAIEIKTVEMVRVPGNVAVTTLASRFVDLICVSGANCGARSPTGGMDTYVAAILSPSETRKKVSKTTQLLRSDIRNISTAAIYSLISVHVRCIRQNVKLDSLERSDRKGFMVLNDETNGPFSPVPLNGEMLAIGEALYYPSLHKTLDALCRASPPSIFSSHDISAESSKKLLTIASAYILGSPCRYGTTRIVDVKLYNFAISQVGNSLRILFEDDEDMVGKRNDSKQVNNDATAKAFSALKPLPAPIMPKTTKSRKKKGPDGSDDCTFAGIFDLTKSQESGLILDEDLFKLYVRAFIKEKTTVEDSSPISVFFSEMLELIQCCYDTRVKRDPGMVFTSQASSSTPQGKTKRRKLAESQVENMRDSVEYRRLNTFRAGLASDIWNVLQLCLTSQFTIRAELQLYLRESFTTDNMCLVLELSGMLDSIMSTARKDGRSSDTYQQYQGIAFSDSGNFNLFERSLWTAHINCCMTLSRGHVSFDPTSHNSTRPILGSASTRHIVFMEIAKTNAKPESAGRWPLCLSGTQHAFVSSNLSSESTAVINQESSSPDRFIAESLINSIADVLKNPIEVSNAVWYRQVESTKTGCEEGTTAECFPLSQKDGRLLLMAVSRLPRSDQIQCLASFVDSLFTGLTELQSFNHRKFVCDHPEVSAFIARVITVCSIMITMVDVGPSLRDALFEQVGSTMYQLPFLVSRLDVINAFSSQDHLWHKRESCFMGVFTDWDSPIIPDVGTLVKKDTLSPLSLSHFETVLEIAFNIGLDAAKDDRGYLLFSAWNASGRRALWDQKLPLEINVRTYSIKELVSPKFFMDLREDICLVYRQIHGSGGGFADSILSASWNNRDQDSLSCPPLNEMLAAMMTKAETVVDALVEGLQTKNCVELNSLLCYSLIEALSVYIAFVVSMHTKPGDSFLKKARHILRRKRYPRLRTGDDVAIMASALSEDDVSGRPEGDYHEDQEEGKVGAFVRLHDACNAFGSAPIYPDWLDESCRYHEGISNTIALDHAERALRCLNSLNQVAFSRYTESLNEVLGSFATDSDNLITRTGIAVRICLQSQEESNAMNIGSDEEGEGDGEFVSSVASIVGLDEAAVRFFLHNVECQNRKSSKKAWCPNSAQRICGFIQDRNMHIVGMDAYPAEYRAGGEWELLLSETLLGACLNTNIERSVDAKMPSLTDQSHAHRNGVKAYATAERWRKVFESGVSHLAPVTALLRFGMSCGAGRKAHPFSDGKVAECTKEIRVNESLPKESEVINITENGKNAIFQTLRLLSKISMSNRGEVRLKRACFAAASNLLVDTDNFSQLEAMNDISFIFSLLPLLTKQLKCSHFVVGDTPEMRCFLLDKLIILLQSRGMATLYSHGSSPPISMIVAYLRDDAFLKIDTIVSASVPYSHLVDAEIETVGESKVIKGGKLRELVQILCDRRFETNYELRSRLVGVLCSVAEDDYRLHTSVPQPKAMCAPLLDQLVKALSLSGKRPIQSMIRASLLKHHGNSGNATFGSLVAHLCRFLSLLVSTPSFVKSNVPDEPSTASSIFEVLMEGVEQNMLWSPESGDDTALTLTFLLGTCESKLHYIGNVLFDLSRSRADTWNAQNELHMLPLEKLFEFVRSLAKALSMRSLGTVEMEKSESSFTGQDISIYADRNKLDNNIGHGTLLAPTSATPRACSFVLRSGFHAQHWYNCYTCGLVWDKGCCTLCALTCHCGHEVAYSRHSSFFCDCGAEVASAVDENRVTCKCISPLSSEDANKMFDCDIAKSFLAKPKSESPTTFISSKFETTVDSAKLVSVHDIAALAFPIKAAMAMQKFKDAADNSKWTSLLFQLLGNLNFPAEENDWSTMIDFGQGFGIGHEKESNSHESLTSKLRSRSGKVISVDRITGMALVPIRAARSGAFNVKLSLDTTTDRLKRAVLLKNGVNRNILACDSRGRFILAEPCSLLFCSALPTVNMTFIPDAIENLSARSQMNILGSATVKFNIVGVKLCIENERHLVVWGVSEALVAILSPHCDSIERSIDLKIDLDRNEGEADFLIKCEWIPGSQFTVAVVCGTAIKVFDIRQTENNRAAPSVSYSLAQDAIVRNVAFVPYHETPLNLIKLYILLDTGRLHAVEMRFDANDEIDDHASRYLESGDCVALPTEGVSSFQGLDPASAGSTSRSLGEGSSLDFLSQSRLLLYKCVSSCVLALVLDNKANVVGSFEFLPNVITSDNLGFGSEGFYMTGPYTLWTEFGIVRNEAFRVLCVAKSSRTNQPRLLSVEFNDHYTRVKEFTWSVTTSVGLGLSLCSSFEGLAVFSSPAICCNNESFRERAYASIVTSSGAMLIYGEDQEECGTTSAATIEAKDTKPKASITIFERLVDISDHNDLTFGGDAVGSDPEGAKMKLSVNNSMSLLSPSREGCTLTIFLSNLSSSSGEKNTESYKRRETRAADIETPPPASKENRDQQDLVIVALRILVGSTSHECIPRQLLVEGRSHQLTADMKRWYDVPFTKMDILLGLRNGFVTVGVASSFSGTNPMIDAIQVYAIDRKTIRSWVPTVCSHPMILTFSTQNIVTSPNPEDTNLSLVRTLRALKHLHHILDSDWKQGTVESVILKRLVRAIAVNGDQKLKEAMFSLLQEVVPDENDRQLFLDEATLSGVAKNLNLALEKLIGGVDIEDDALRVVLIQAMRGSLKASINIAECRPRNYALSTEKLISEKTLKGSISKLARDLLEEAYQNDQIVIALVDDVVKLILLEIGICHSLIGVEKELFPSISLIGELLHSSSASVVQRCSNAIAEFVESKEKRPIGSSIDKIVDMASQPIAYQCDSCSKFPITDLRYTLPEGDNYDIDLCTNCFLIADQYAMRHLYDDSSTVVINGKTIGEGTKLSCREVNLMRPVPIFNGPLVEQAVMEVKTAVAHGNSIGKGSFDEDSSLKKALSRQENMGESVDFAPLVESLFHDILELTSSVLSRSDAEKMSDVKTNSLLSLVLRFIKTSKNEEVHLSRAKLFAMVVAKHLSTLLSDLSRSNAKHSRKLQLINCLRSLSQLLASNYGSEALVSIESSSMAMSSPPKSKDKTDPRFVCDEHVVPAVRRRCSRGIHKNRRFYVCGVERRHRCTYFRWADDDEEELEPSPPQSAFSKEMETTLWKFMEEPHQKSQIPLSTQLCDLLESELINHDRNIDSILPSEVKSSGLQNKSGAKSLTLASIFDRKRALAELNDSVYCSREKLLGISGDFLLMNESRNEALCALVDEMDEKDVEDKVVEAILDLVSAVAGTVVNDYSHDDSNTHARWFSLLCEIISLSPSEQFRSQAKRALKRLCGGRRALYHSVRDHYVFGFQFRLLLQHASGSLQASLDVREQAKQCGPHWSDEPCAWETIDAGALLGTLDLISEDTLSVANNKRIGAILDELINVTKSRGGNWRQFCGLFSLPRTERNLKSNAHNDHPISQTDETNFSGTPPIVLLLWVACSLPGPNQVKVLKLIECALTSDSNGIQSESLPDGLDVADDDTHSLDGTPTIEKNGLMPPGTNPLASVIINSCPEEILLSPEKGLSVNELHAFVLQFVLRGRSQEIRKFSSLVASTLCQQLSHSCIGSLFMSLVSYPFTEIHSHGSSSIQFLQLLQALLGFMTDSVDVLDLFEVARKLTQCFCDQMYMLGANGRGNKVCTFEASGQGREAVRKRFDLSKCVHCNRVKPITAKGNNFLSQQQRQNHGARTSLNRSRSSSRCNTPVGAMDGLPWLPEQVRPYIKGQLDASIDTSVSDEFNLFVQLKCRLAISDVHLTINDPRGRFVKTIVLYFTPRQVNDVAELKSIDYSSRWQQCGMLSLTRGATRISYTLPVSIVAANLRFEYKDFFERPGGSRGANGSPILHCPRCTRVVNNAHGVCGHCGEVAFQCRKCRHINYDRFDSFLCVECSYCSAGTFCYEITAGVASNAVAIVDDETYYRSVKLLRVATNLYCELKGVLEEKIRTADKKRSRTAIPDNFDGLGPDLKRVFMGELPNDSGNRNTLHPPSEATRARSLLRLARSLRNDTDRSSNRRELLVREAFLGSNAGHELALEDFGDPDGDLAGFVNVERLSSDTDPLSRLVASIQGRRENMEVVADLNIRPSNANRANRPLAPDAGSFSNTKSLMEECEKLYHLMREAEREGVELARRINAWQRLEHNALAEIPHPLQLEARFTPTHCTKCSGPVTLHLLTLVMRLFPDMSGVPLTKEFVKALFLEPQNLSKDLFDLKRLAITTLARTSETGAQLVLAELQGRLKTSSNSAAAQILGKLLAEGDFPLAHQFVTLARQTLGSGFL